MKALHLLAAVLQEEAVAIVVANRGMSEMGDRMMNKKRGINIIAPNTNQQTWDRVAGLQLRSQGLK